MYGDSHRDGGSPGCWESLKEGMGKSHGKLPRKLIQRESSDPSKAYMRVSCLNCKAKEQEEVGTRLPQKPQRLLLCSTVVAHRDTPILGEDPQRIRHHRAAQTQSISCRDSALLCVYRPRQCDVSVWAL